MAAPINRFSESSGPDQDGRQSSSEKEWPLRCIRRRGKLQQVQVMVETWWPQIQRSCLICVMKQKWKPKESVRERWDIFSRVDGDRECLESFLRLQISKSERHGEIADKESAVWLVVQRCTAMLVCLAGTFPEQY